MWSSSAEHVYLNWIFSSFTPNKSLKVCFPFIAYSIQYQFLLAVFITCLLSYTSAPSSANDFMAKEDEAVDVETSTPVSDSGEAKALNTESSVVKPTLAPADISEPSTAAKVCKLLLTGDKEVDPLNGGAFWIKGWRNALCRCTSCLVRITISQLS